MLWRVIITHFEWNFSKTIQKLGGNGLQRYQNINQRLKSQPNGNNDTKII
jgi:hypothetical protein